MELRDDRNGVRVFRVSELTRWIKTVLEREVGSVCVEGEVSNVRQPASGHVYFTIKDEGAQLTAVMFRGDQRGLRFAMRDGMLVRATGAITVYERGGNYQLVVRKIEAGGKGDLHARFEALKAKLAAEGLFDSARKRKLPLLPQHIGLVTSPTGAAIRDILNIINRRFPNVHMLLAPVRVQGEGAAEEIAAAIGALNRIGGIDVMIVGRGGGSLEDLWCFNEEIVARAVAASDIPVISAVGHETDFTICDFVADLRAPTPSAAAELVVGRKDELAERIDVLGMRIRQSIEEDALRARNRLLALAGNPVFREPRAAVQAFRHRVDGAGQAMRHAVEGVVMGVEQEIDTARTRMAHAVALRRQAGAERVLRLKAQLDALDPLAVLRRGYSVVTGPDGNVLRSVACVRPGVPIAARVADGTVDATVTGVRGADDRIDRGRGSPEEP
jgi:exodeoxyribonuclease VII large subunit